MKLDDHPTVKKYLKTKKKPALKAIDYQRLRDIVLDAGADDVGFVEIGREDLSDQRDNIQNAFPGTKSIISYICRLNVPQLRSIDRRWQTVDLRCHDRKI